MKSYWQQYEIALRNAAGVKSELPILDNFPDHNGVDIVAEDWTSIPEGNCRCCKDKIWLPYERIYYEVFPQECKKAYGFYNSYCQECAKKKAEIKHKPPYRPKVVDVTRDMYGRETVTYDDGCVSTELDINQTYKGDDKE